MTYVSYVFVSKRSIVGFLSYRPLKMILVMIFSYFYRSVGVWWPRTAKRKIRILKEFF